MRGRHHPESGRRGIFGFLSQATKDVVSQTSGTAMIVFSAFVFVAAAAGGQTLIGALGDFGWIAYITVLGVIAMSLGPVFVVGVKVRLRGSAKHRAEVEERIRQQRIKFGLVSASSRPHEGPGGSPAGAESERSATRKATT